MNNCKEIKDCGCNQVEFCGCNYKVDLKCTNYNGDRLTPLNVNPGATGHDIVILINRFLKDLAENIQTDTTDIQSVGNGLRIYKGLSSDYKNQIKTLLKGDGITLTETENEILISVDTAWIDSKLSFQNIGQGQGVYQNIQGKHSFSRILSDDSSITVTKKSDGSINLVANGIKGVVSDGAGLSIEKGVNPEGNIVLKKLGSSDDSVSISTSLDGGIDLKTAGPKGVESIGTGARLEDGLTGDRKLRLKTIKSSTLNIETSPDGTLTIDSVDKGFGYIKSFYVNDGYNPTADSPSDGSIIRPYVSFDQAIAAVIGNGTFHNPQYRGAEITLQTSSRTALNPTINNLNIKFEAGSILTYTGTDEYMFDTELIYPHIPKGSRGELSRQIFIVLKGNGGIQRTNGIGLVRGIGSNRNEQGIVSDPVCRVAVGNTSSDRIVLYERDNYPADIWEGDVTNANGSKFESHYGYPFKWTTKLQPTMPLVWVEKEAKAPFNYGVTFSGTTVIRMVANTGIYVGPNTLLTGGTFEFIIAAHAVSTKSGVKMVEYPGVYEPKDGVYCIETHSSINIQRIHLDEQQGFGNVGVDAMIKVYNNSTISKGTLNITANYYAKNFLDTSDSSNTGSSFYLNTTSEGAWIVMPQCKNLIKTPRNTFTLVMPNTRINVGKLSENTSLRVSANTRGTMSSFKENPILSGIPTYAGAAAALTAGLMNNSIIYDSTTNGLKTI